MQLAVLGLNHNSAPVAIRERLAVSDDKLQHLYEKILQNDRIYETVIISTCNRVEYYLVTDDFLCNVENVVHIVASENNIDTAELRKYTYIHCGLDAVKHIFKVASGLDSLVLGEPQIFGQVKDAFRSAKLYGKIDTFLNKLEESTIKIAKKVRTNTGIGENPVSVSYAAVELSKRIFSDIQDKSALIVGAGEMCELAAKHLAGASIKKIYVTNRTYEKAEKLAKEVHGEAVDFNSFTSVLPSVDIIISSTGATDYIITYEQIEKIMHKRKYEPMFFIDIAVPRDIDPKINELENIYVYDIDDLKSVVEANKKSREKEALKALDFINDAIDDFSKWIESSKIVPIIKGVRFFFEETKESEFQRFIEKYKIDDLNNRQMLNHFVNSYMNKVLHPILTNLKNKGIDKHKYTLAEAAEILLNLKEN